MLPIQCSVERHFECVEGEFRLGDAEALLPSILKEYEGKAHLIYLDPPFQTGDTFKIQLNDKSVVKTAYSDKLPEAEYLRFMRNILEGCHALLSDEGSIYLHVDYRMSAKLRLMLDDIFGSGNLMNEIIWMYKSGGRSTRHFSRKHDNILFYRKSGRVYFDIAAASQKRGREKRNNMKRFIDDEGRVCYSIRTGGKTYVYNEDTLVYPSDVWTDISHLHQKDPERNGYATQKPEALLSRIILASCPPGGLVVDLFCGSGTTAAVSGKAGRRFLVCDNSPYSLYALRKRLVGAYEPAHPIGSSATLTLMYDSATLTADAQATAFIEGGAINITLTGAKELLYCALGTVEADAFTPCAMCYSPEPSFTLRAPKSLTKPVLQIMNTKGEQGFFKVSIQA